MAKVIKITDELYEELREAAYINRVSMQDLASTALKAGIEECKKSNAIMKDRLNRDVVIKW